MLKRSMPWLLAASERLLPLARLTPAFVQQRVLERSLNHLLAEALADGLFEVLTDRWLALEIQDLGLRWCISQRGLDQQLVIAQQAPVEVCISGQWRDFFYCWLAAKKIPIVYFLDDDYRLMAIQS